MAWGIYYSMRKQAKWSKWNHTSLRNDPLVVWNQEKAKMTCDSKIRRREFFYVNCRCKIIYAFHHSRIFLYLPDDFCASLLDWLDLWHDWHAALLQIVKRCHRRGWRWTHGDQMSDVGGDQELLSFVQIDLSFFAIKTMKLLEIIFVLKYTVSLLIKNVF